MPDSDTPLRALIVDDNRMAQSVIFQTLERLDLEFEEIRVAETGADALAVYQELVGDGMVLILLDLDMPVMGGLEALSAIRVFEQESRLPPCCIAVVSVMEDNETIKQCYASGADAFFQKPLRPQALTELLREERWA